jgi:tRNA (guanine37-N1)-methyltransferase
MVLKPEPVFDCVDSLGFAARADRVAKNAKQSVVLLSAQGSRFDQKLASELAGLDEIALICGRYEGVDERVNTALADREISIGDYVLSGGELGAAVILDTVTRLLPGALGNEASSRQESFTAHSDPGSTSTGPDSTCASGGLLDYPHFTRPAEFRGISVPDVLTSGDHEKIRLWRRRSALEKTLRNRPDLLAGAELSKEDREIRDTLLAQAQELASGNG